MSTLRLFPFLVVLLSSCSIQYYPGNPDWKSLSAQAAKHQPLVSAHRGGRYLNGYPENALETFQYLHQQLKTQIIEFDVAMTADSHLVVMHDSTLQRTTSCKGPLRAYTLASLNRCRLVLPDSSATDYHIPSYEEILDWAKDQQVLWTVDRKAGVPWNLLAEPIRRMKLQDRMALITYTLEDAVEVHQLYPDLYLSVTIRSLPELNAYLDAGVPTNRMLAFTGTEWTDNKQLLKKLDKLGIPAMLGTLGKLDKEILAKKPSRYKFYVRKGIDIIATDYPLEAARGLGKAM